MIPCEFDEKMSERFLGEDFRESLRSAPDLGQLFGVEIIDPID